MWLFRGSLVEALCYKPDGHGLSPDEVDFFNLPKPSSSTRRCLVTTPNAVQLQSSLAAAYLTTQLGVAWLQFSNKDYSSRPYCSRTALPDGRLKTAWQRQSYFTTGGLPPISSSWRQAPWGPWGPRPWREQHRKHRLPQYLDCFLRYCCCGEVTVTEPLSGKRACLQSRSLTTAVSAVLIIMAFGVHAFIYMNKPRI
jgi:hypothetical protein